MILFYTRVQYDLLTYNAQSTLNIIIHKIFMIMQYNCSSTGRLFPPKIKVLYNLIINRKRAISNQTTLYKLTFNEYVQYLILLNKIREYHNYCVCNV